MPDETNGCVPEALSKQKMRDKENKGYGEKREL